MTRDDFHAGNPRIWKKKPQQSRSINTVKSILEAAEEVFNRKGFHHTRAEDIAARAGIGVASLYDYFPNKTAIAHALFEETTSDIIGSVRAVFLEKKNSLQTFRDGLPSVVNSIYSGYRKHKKILIDLVAEVPELRQSDVYSLDRLIHQASLTYLRVFWDEIQIHDLQRAHAFICLLFTSGIKQYLINPPPELSEQDFLEQMSELIIDYLTRHPSVSA
jgi:AcrR family transcriptional regulator